MATYTYTTPTQVLYPRPSLSQSDPARLFPQEFLEVTEGITVIRESGTWTQVTNPTQTRLAAAQDYMLGGHVYTGVSETTKTEIETDAVGGSFVVE